MATQKTLKWCLKLALQRCIWLFCLIVLILKIQLVRYLIVFYVPWPDGCMVKNMFLIHPVSWQIGYESLYLTKIFGIKANDYIAI